MGTKLNSEYCSQSVDGNHIFPREGQAIGSGEYVQTCAACGKMKRQDVLKDLEKMYQPLDPNNQV